MNQHENDASQVDDFSATNEVYAQERPVRGQKRAHSGSPLQCNLPQQVEKTLPRSMDRESGATLHDRIDLSFAGRLALDLQEFYCVWPAETAVWSNTDDGEDWSDIAMAPVDDSGSEGGSEGGGECGDENGDVCEAQGEGQAQVEELGQGGVAEEYPEPRSFVAVVAPIGAGKTHLGLRLSRHKVLWVVRVGLGALPGSEGTQTVSPEPLVAEHTKQLCMALDADWATLGELDASVLLDDRWQRASYTVRFLSSALGLLTSADPPQPCDTVRSLRAALWARINGIATGKLRASVLFVDDATGVQDQRMRLLREMVRATGLACVFASTSIDICQLPAACAWTSSRCAIGLGIRRHWARFITPLPPPALTCAEEASLKELTERQKPLFTSSQGSADTDTARFLQNISDTTAAGRSINPLLLHRLWDAYNTTQGRPATVDGLLAHVSTLLYAEKPQLRTADGLRAQLQYALGDDLGFEDHMCVQTHFGRYLGDLSVLLYRGELYTYGDHGRLYLQLFRPAPALPTLHEDPLLPLIVGGCCSCSVSNHPAPYALSHGSRDTTLTAAAALQFLRSTSTSASAFPEVPSKSTPSLRSQNRPLSMLRDGQFLECVTALAALSASRANGLGGTPLRDFLLRFVTELQAEVPDTPLQWDTGSDLGLWFEGANTVIPALLCLHPAPYPSEVVPGLGRLSRMPGEVGLDGRLFNSEGVQIASLYAGQRGVTADDAVARILSDFASHPEVRVGIAVVSAEANEQTCTVPSDTHVLRLQRRRNKVTLTPLYASEARESGSTPLRKRVLFVVECDQARLSEQVRVGPSH